MRRMNRILPTVGAAVAAAAVVAAALTFGDDETPAESGQEPEATAEVVRRDLAKSEEVEGTLSYGEVQTLSGALPGTITWLPEVGATIETGDAVWDVDDRPVTAMDGLLPMWRPLTPGTEGADVAQLEENLAALGYDGFTVDDEYTYATAEIVEQWQDDIGAPETGTVAVGEVVFTTSAIRVAEQTAEIGSPGVGAVLGITGSEQHVAIELEVTLQELVAEGQPVTVTLPDGTETAGEVAGVAGTVTASSSGEGSDDEGSEEEATVRVTIALADPEAVAGLESAPVKVALVAEVHEDVLVVPVEALLALREGGYAVEVVDEDSEERVPVETGIFAGGLVEVSGEGLAEGATVAVPE